MLSCLCKELGEAPGVQQPLQIPCAVEVDAEAGKAWGGSVLPVRGRSTASPGGFAKTSVFQTRGGLGWSQRICIPTDSQEMLMQLVQTKLGEPLVDTDWLGLC